jgi:hypothetical protein
MIQEFCNKSFGNMVGSHVGLLWEGECAMNDEVVLIFRAK